MAIGPLAVLAIGPDVPMQALTRLRDGNARFVSGASLPRVPRAPAGRGAIARTPGGSKRAATLAAIEEIMNVLVSRSDVVRHRVAAEQVVVIGGYYDSTSGRVHFSSPVDAGEVRTLPEARAAR